MAFTTLSHRFFPQATASWRIAYGATLLVPWLLIFNRGAADASCVIIGLLWLWESHRTKQWAWTRDWVVRVGLVAWAWLLLAATPLALDPAGSLHTALPWIRYILLYAALRYWVLLRPHALEFLAATLAVMLTFVCADTLWQYCSGTSLTGHPLGATGRLSGPFNNVKVGIFIAKMLLPTVALCLFFSLLRQRGTWVAGSLALYAVGITTIMLSGERTAFLSTVIATVLLVALLAACEPKLRKGALLSLGGLFTLAALLFATQPWVQARAGDMGAIIASAMASPYAQLFKAGYIIGADNWETGVGLKGFRLLCPNLILLEKVDNCNIHPHNPYLEWFSEAGAMGLALFLSLIAAMAYYCIRALRAHQGTYRLLAAFSLAGLVCHFFPLMPTQSQFSNWPGILLWYSLSLGLASLNALTRHSREGGNDAYAAALSAPVSDCAI